VKIAFVTSTFPSISQTFILSQVTALLDLDHDVRIFAFGAESGIVHEDVAERGLLDRTVYLVPPPGALRRYAAAAGMFPRIGPGNIGRVAGSLNPVANGPGVVNLRALYSWMPLAAGRPYDIVHCHFGGVGRRVVPAVPAVRPGAFVTTFYGHDVYRETQAAQGLYHRLAVQGDAFIALSGPMRQDLIALGLPEAKTFIHPLGIYSDRFRPRKRVSVPGPVEVITIARLVEKKGIEFALRAVAEYSSRPGALPLSYKIVGEGPLRTPLEATAAELGLGQCVRFLGAKSQRQVEDLIGEADVFLLPSVTAADGDKEGTPTTLIEAQAMGIPVLSTIHSGIPEIVEGGVTGFLAPERDVPALSSRLGQLVEDAELRSSMGMAGRARVLERYDARKLADRQVDIYRRLIKR